MHGEFCKVCKSDHVKIERVRQLAMQKYPKLQKLSTAEFVEALWKRLQKLSK